MFVYKCDICKKEIKNGDETKVSPPGELSGPMFCQPCAKPILAFLKKHKLLQEN
jgi:DNA-directed RNA polymerase subunit RPC12/RpoP